MVEMKIEKRDIAVIGFSALGGFLLVLIALITGLCARASLSCSVV